MFIVLEGEVLSMILEGTVTLMVSDVDKSLNFHQKILGLKLKEKYGSKYAEVQVDGFVIGLHARNEDRLVTESDISVGFRVEDLQKSVAYLKSRGVEFSTEGEEGVAGKFAYFADPDGNPFYLWQSKSKK